MCTINSSLRATLCTVLVVTTTKVSAMDGRRDLSKTQVSRNNEMQSIKFFAPSSPGSRDLRGDVGNEFTSTNCWDSSSCCSSVPFGKSLGRGRINFGGIRSFHCIILHMGTAKLKLRKDMLAGWFASLLLLSTSMWPHCDAVLIYKSVQQRRTTMAKKGEIPFFLPLRWFNCVFQFQLLSTNVSQSNAMHYAGGETSTTELEMQRMASLCVNG